MRAAARAFSSEKLAREVQGALAALDHPVDGVDGLLARDLSGGVPAHAIGHDPQPQLVVAQVRVFIDLPAPAEVRRAVRLDFESAGLAHVDHRRRRRHFPLAEPAAQRKPRGAPLQPRPPLNNVPAMAAAASFVVQTRSAARAARELAAACSRVQRPAGALVFTSGCPGRGRGDAGPGVGRRRSEPAPGDRVRRWRR